MGLQGYMTDGQKPVLKSLGFFKYNCTIEGTVQLSNGSEINSNGTVVQNFTSII